MSQREWMPHVTVATIVFNDGKYLMVEEIREGRKVLNQPAGHVERRESLPQAAVRETLEETGWEVELEAVLGASLFSNPVTGDAYYRTSFLALPMRFHPDMQLDEGILGSVWLSYEELIERSEQLRSESVMATIEQHRSGRRFALDFFYPEVL